MKQHRTMPMLNKHKGFTLIEFLVASALAIIVIMAAGGTYLITRKLNQSAQQRLDIQQNLRNMSTQVLRDARLAGTFGCYTTGNTKAQITDIIAPTFAPTVVSDDRLRIDTSNNNGFGIRKEDFGGLPALYFVYGQGETGISQIQGLTTSATNTITNITLANGTNNKSDTDQLRQTLAGGGYAVLSSCKNAVAMKFAPSSSTSTNVLSPNLTGEFSLQDSGEMVLSKLYASAYIFDKPNKKVFRADVDNKGTWGNMQLIATGVNEMDVAFGYTDNCPAKVSGTAAETFTFSNTLSQTKLPSLVQIRLNYDVDVPDKSGARVAMTTADYIINATVHAGNVCGTRMPTS